MISHFVPRIQFRNQSDIYKRYRVFSTTTLSRVATIHSNFGRPSPPCCRGTDNTITQFLQTWSSFLGKRRVLTLTWLHKIAWRCSQTLSSATYTIPPTRPSHSSHISSSRWHDLLAAIPDIYIPQTPSCVYTRMALPSYPPSERSRPSIFQASSWKRLSPKLWAHIFDYFDKSDHNSSFHIICL